MDPQQTLDVFRFAIRVFCDVHRVEEDDLCPHLWRQVAAIAHGQRWAAPDNLGEKLAALERGEFYGQGLSVDAGEVERLLGVLGAIWQRHQAIAKALVESFVVKVEGDDEVPGCSIDWSPHLNGCECELAKSN